MLKWFCYFKFKNGTVQRYLVSSSSEKGAELRAQKMLKELHTRDELRALGEYEFECKRIME